jgi:hypothetical protein
VSAVSTMSDMSALSAGTRNQFLKDLVLGGHKYSIYLLKCIMFFFVFLNIKTQKFL